jgi:hypothetical protein
MTNGDVVTKSAFAAIVGVSAARVSEWLAEKKISGDALVGTGCRARINVAIAREQLRKNLDPRQHLGMNGKARLDGPAAFTGPRQARPAITVGGTIGPAASGARCEAEAPVEDRIKNERLEKLALSNAKEREAAAARSGRYILADDARLATGRAVGRLLTTVEAGLTEFANAIMANPPGSPRGALRMLRTAWREIRVRNAKAIGAEAFDLPATIEDMGEGAPK